MSTKTLARISRATTLMFAAAVLLMAQNIHAQSAFAPPSARILADMARTGYSEEVEDMYVKVLGGYITIDRTLIDSRWIHNRNWLPAVATTGCGGRKISRGQYIYEYGGTETFTFEGEEREADVFTFFTDRRFIAIQDPGNPPPEPILSASIESSGSGGGPAIGCVDVPVQYLAIRWEDSFGNWIEYDGSDGRILRYGDRNDIQVSFDYNADDTLDGVNDHFGARMVTYAYEAGRITSVTDYTNRQVQYIWGGSNLDRVIDIRGNEWAYTYNGDGRLTKVVDPEGRQKLITLYPTGGVESVIMAEPGETEGVGTFYSYAYDATRVEFTSIQRKTGGREEAVTYDENGLIVREDVNGTTLYTLEVLNGTRKRVRTDHNGNQTTSEYDERNNLIRRTYADGSVVTRTYNEFSQPLRAVDEAGNITQFEYDDKGNTERVTEAVGTSAERVTEFDYDAYGQVEEVRKLGDASTQLATTTLTYDSFGNLRTRTDPENYLEEWTRDAMGNPLVHTDRRGKLWTRTWDDAGYLTAFEDPNGNVLRRVIDGTSNLVLEIDAALYETRYEYDARGNQTAIVDELDGRTEFSYDSNDELTAVTDADGKVQLTPRRVDGRVSSEIDGAGNEVSYDYGNPATSNTGFYGQPSTIIHPTFTRTQEYNRRGWLSRSIDDLGGGEVLETLFDYDAVGRPLSITDPRGSETRIERDAEGRVVKVTDALNDETLNTYDDRNNLVSVTDPRSKTIQFEYDLLNRPSAEVKPLGQRTEFFYDGVGNRTRIDDAKGQRIDFQYDDSNRPLSIEYYRDRSNTTPNRTHSFVYNSRDMLETWDDGTTSGMRTYDELRRVRSETINYGAFSLTYSFTYNANGTVDTFTDADDTVYRYVYDEANKPQGLIIPGIGTVAINEFEWLEPKRRSMPGGTTEEFQYTPYQEIAGILVTDASGTPIADRSVTYDAARNVATKNTEEGDTSYDYDAADRLTDATRTAVPDKAYTYDGMGNRLTLDGDPSTWTYDDNNRLVSAGSITYTYDDNGNVASRDTGSQITNYFYDVQNRLERVEEESGTIIAEYGYDVFDRRVWKEVSGVRTYYLYSNMGLIGEYDETGVPLKSYGYFPGSGWGQRPAYMKAANGYNFFHNDHLDTPYMLTDQNGAVSWRGEADPFGATTVTIELVTNNLRFPGQYFDDETGLHYNYHRTYDPSTGRYLQSDPIGLIGGINTYAYVEANPLRNVDPHGLQASPAEADDYTYRQFQIALKGRGISNRQVADDYYYPYKDRRTERRINEMGRPQPPRGPLQRILRGRRSNITIWETPASEGCYPMTWSYHYKWRCKNATPRTEPNGLVCRQSDYEPEYIFVYRNYPGSPAGDCTFVESIPDEFHGVYCPRDVVPVEYPRQIFLEPVR